MSLSHSSRPGVFALFASVALASTGAACSSSEGGSDLTDAAAAGDSPASSSDSGSTDSGSTTDSPTTPPVDGAPSDAKPAGDGGLGYLQECTTVGNPGDCAAGLQCKLFKGRAKNFCTKPCTGPADCPAPSKGCGGDNFCSPP